MAVLYSRIFVAIRRRSKLEIWQNAVVVAGGSRATTTDSTNAATSRKLIDEREESDAEAVSCRSRGRDDRPRPGLRPLGHEAASPQPSTFDRSPDRRRVHLDARTARRHADEMDEIADDRQRQSPSSAVDGRRKCVRFLLVRRRESDSNDVDDDDDDDLDQIEMWSDRRNNDDCGTASDERPADGGSGLPARLIRRLRQHRKSRGPRQSSLSSDVKAAKQLGVIMGAFCVCFLPYFVCFVVVAVCHQCVDDQLMTTVTWIGYINSTLNPFLYPLCNQQFRVSFRRMFASVRNLGSTTRRPVAGSVAAS